MSGKICIVAAWVMAAAGVHAQPRPIDAKASSFTVRVFKAGVFSAFGHDHTITAPVANGTVDAGGRQVELHVTAASLRVVDTKASENDRVQVQKTMEGTEVLDVSRYPEIAFKSISAESKAGGVWTVRGNLTLHGATRPVTVEVKESGGHFTGAALLKQTDFGMKPVKVAGGTVKVKDEVRVEFDIQLAK